MAFAPQGNAATAAVAKLLSLCGAVSYYVWYPHQTCRAVVFFSVDSEGRTEMYPFSSGLLLR